MTKQKYVRKVQLPIKKLVSNIEPQTLFNMLILELIIVHEEMDDEIEEFIQILMSNLMNLIDIKIYFGHETNIINSNILNLVHSQISQLQKIESLQLLYDRNQSIELINIQVLAETLQKLINIKTLRFSTPINNLIDNKGIQCLMNCIINLQNLEDLSLKFNQNIQLDNKCFVILANSFKKLQKITKFSLKVEQNNIRAIGAQGIASCLKNLKTLKILKLKIKEGNNINSDGYKSIGLGLVQLKQLECLKVNITENEQVDSSILQKLIKGMSSMIYLKSLDLRLKANYKIQAEIVKQFQITLKSLINLSVLKINLENCIIEGEKNLIAFESIFKNLLPLIEFEYNINPSNKVNENFTSHILQGIEHLKDTQILHLTIQNSSKLTIQEVNSFQNIFKSNNNLQELHLKIQNNCVLDQKIFPQLCQQFSLLLNINKFHLEIGKKNFINSDYLNQFCKNLVKLNQLTHLNLNFQQDNIIDQSNMLSLSSLFQQMHQLQELHLQIGENNLTQSGVLQLSKYMNTLNQLKSLNLKIAKNNIINASEFNQLFSQIGDIISLLDLSIIIDNEESIQINDNIRVFQKLINIQQLRIEMKINIITDNEFFLFSDIEYLSNLQKIKFEIDSDNSLTLPIQIVLVSKIVNLQKLSSIELNIKGKCLLTTQCTEKKYCFLQLQSKDIFFCFQQQGINSNDLEWSEETFKNFHSIISFQLILKDQRQMENQKLVLFFIYLKYLTKLKYFKLDFEMTETSKNDYLNYISQTLFNFTELIVLSIKYGSLQKNFNESNLYLALKNLAKLKDIDLFISFKHNFNISMQIKMIDFYSDQQKMKNIKIYFIGVSSNISFEKTIIKDKCQKNQNNLQFINMECKNQQEQHTDENVNNDNNAIIVEYQENQIQLENNDKQIYKNEKDDKNYNQQHINMNIQQENELNFYTIFKLQISQSCQIDSGDIKQINLFMSSTNFNKLQIILHQQHLLEKNDFNSLGQSLKNQNKLENLELDIHDHESLNRDSFECILEGIQQQMNNLKYLEINISNSCQTIFDIFLFIKFLFQNQKQIPQMKYTLKFDEFLIRSAQYDFKSNRIIILGNGVNKIHIYQKSQLEIKKQQMKDIGDGFILLNNNIKQLDFKLNQSKQLTNDGGVLIQQALTTLNQLQNLTLDILYTIEEKQYGFDKISNGLQSMNQLQCLNLYLSKNFICNKLSSDILGKSLSQMLELITLKLDFQNEFFLQDTDVFSFARNICQLPKLVNIYLQLKSFQTLECQIKFLQILSSQYPKRNFDFQFKGQCNFKYYNLKYFNIFDQNQLAIQNKSFESLEISKDKLNKFDYNKETLIKFIEILKQPYKIQINFENDDNQNNNTLTILKDVINVFENELKFKPKIYIIERNQHQNLIQYNLSQSFKILRNIQQIEIRLDKIYSINISMFKDILQSLSLLSQVNLFQLQANSINYNLNQYKCYVCKKLKRLVILNLQI